GAIDERPGDQELAQLSFGDVPRPPQAARLAAALRPVGHDLPVLAGRLEQLGPFPHVVAARLFAVHVLAGLAGPDPQQRMPVIRRGDGDRVDLLVLDELPRILRGLRVAAEVLLDLYLATVDQRLIRI